MAGDLDFSVQLRLLNDQFNNGINEARDRFTAYAQSVQRNVQQMNADTERATTMLAGLNNVSPDRLTAEIRATADQLRQMGAGANISGDQIEAAMQASALQVTRLGRQLDVARQEAVRLSQTGASPQEVEQAADNVNRLEQELGQARSASVSLANELSGAMNRASSTAANARNEIYRITNIRVPETIRGEIDQISRSLVDFQNNSGRPAAEIDRVTREAEEQIRRLERELNGLDDTQDRVSQGAGGLGGNVDRLKGAFGGLQGLLAAAGLGIGVSEIIETADAFKTLEARIKLATGEGAAFITGFEGVKEIANETFSSIESTGELFARISQAGESLGLAQGEILSVTRTINEAIKLSGGSAASADAAITQLIQGLQSGVVRGEEFNSIMEQAPRLAKAMADGLGVTRGELRAMAQDGKLSSEVVINAVRSQGEAIAGEFATLPTTVSNSLQVVKNQIFNFVGEIDGALNQTSKLAEGISYIGDSLEDLDPAVVSALTDTFENSLGAVVELGEGIRDAYVMLSDLVNALTSNTSDATEQVGLLTRSLQGIGIIAGFIKDGFSAIGIAAEFVVASLYGAMSDLANIASKLTFGELSDKYKVMADNLQVLSKETWEKGKQDVLDWESSGVKSLDNAAKTTKERFAEMAADSEAAYRKMTEDANATAEQQEAALVKYALDNIKANDNVISDKLRVELAEKNLQAVISDTGKASIESAKEAQAAYLGVGESFAEVALKAQESGKSIELSLAEAIHKANTRGAVEDISNSLQAMANQGLITGEQLALGQNIAKTQMSNVEAQITQNMETFGDYAAEVIQKSGGITEANRNVIKAQLEQRAAAMGLAVQMSETGDITVTELDKATVASGRTKEEIDKLAGAAGVGLSAGFIKSKEGLDELVDGYDDLEKAGYDAGGAVINALTEMSNKASNTAEIENLTLTWNELYKEGKITGQELAEGLEGVQNRADILKNGINGVTEAYGFLGIKTREELAKDAKAYTDSYRLVMAEGKLTAQQQEEVFTKMAKANTAANGGVIDSFTRAQAAAKGFTVDVDANGRTVVARMGEAANATTQSALATRAHTQSLDNNTASTARNSGAIRANTAERKQQSISVWNAKFATDEATKSESASLAFMQKAEAGIKSKITALNQLSGSTATADESYQKLMRSMGFVDGFKWLSMADYARDMNRVNAAVDRQAESYSANNMKYRRSNKNDDSSIDNNQDKLDRMMAGANAQYAQPQPVLPQSALDAIANLSKTPNFDASKGGGPVKTIKLDLSFNGKEVSTEMNAANEGALMALLQQLQDSKAIAGY